MTMGPGKELRDYLDQIYRSSASQSKFSAKIDFDLMGNGEIENAIYDSHINFVVRRLVTSAEELRREFSSEDYGQTRFKAELTKYLRDFTRYPERHLSELVRLLSLCSLESRREPTDSLKNSLRRKAREQDKACYICGRELDFSKNANGTNAATVDHIWPRSLGGSSGIDNLAIACQECNNRLRSNHIDGSDYHYEFYSFLENPADASGENKRRLAEVAVLARSEFKCAVCHRPAAEVGQLIVGRIERSDGWHFFNMTTYCQHCYSKE